MIYSLTGRLLETAGADAVIECGGVGYLVSLPAAALGALPAPGQTATVYTCLAVGDSAVALYGFLSPAQRQMFMLLTGVSGVGPKVGLAILSAMTPDAIVLAVSAGDHKAFTAAQGVGPKLGQRLVLELRDKVAKGISAQGIELADIAGSGGFAAAPQQAAAALVSLGYTQAQAAQAVAPVDPSLPLAEIIRIALQGLGRQR